MGEGRGKEREMGGGRGKEREMGGGRRGGWEGEGEGNGRGKEREMGGGRRGKWEGEGEGKGEGVGKGEVYEGERGLVGGGDLPLYPSHLTSL